MEISNKISSLKGVGVKTSNLLLKCGISNLEELLLYFPRDYEQYTFFSDIKKCVENKRIIIRCCAVKIEKDFRSREGRIISAAVFNDGENNFKAKWFNQPYAKGKLVPGEFYNLAGKVQIIKNEYVIFNPVIYPPAVENDFIEPVYPLKEGLTNKLFSKLISQVLEKSFIKDNLPEYLISNYKLFTLDGAIRTIHKPENFTELNKALERLKFQELLIYSIKMFKLKDYINENKEGVSFRISEDLKKLKEILPFPLTEAQNRTLREILTDQKKLTPMNRLIQGDVGSGKTIVALISAFNVVKNGYQAAILAPTEILASQHLQEAKKLFENFNINVEILTGSLSEKQKEKIKEQLKAGEIDIIIGTHALLEDNVEFFRLGFVVTDEQHRFGVLQRSKLYNKGNNIDVLVMTATPIPRTLSLYLYGDLDISVIDELPPGRQKISTYYVDKKSRDRIYKFALKEIQNGRQVYVVCPLVEENSQNEVSSVEKLYEELKKDYFQDVEAEILHGKLSPKIKDAAMSRFKTGETKILISTTVIEVGINVPNASLIIIEDADRFGLAQLHQLRGRVGRGSQQSYCILVTDAANEITQKRMEIIKSSNDGFYIAEQDMKLRGCGEVFGFKQHGEDGLLLSNIIEDINILKISNVEAKRLINSKDEKDIVFVRGIFDKIKDNSRYICFN